MVRSSADMRSSKVSGGLNSPSSSTSSTKAASFSFIECLVLGGEAASNTWAMSFSVKGGEGVLGGGGVLGDGVGGEVLGVLGGGAPLGDGGEGVLGGGALLGDGALWEVEEDEESRGMIWIAFVPDGLDCFLGGGENLADG